MATLMPPAVIVTTVGAVNRVRRALRRAERAAKSWDKADVRPPAIFPGRVAHLRSSSCARPTRIASPGDVGARRRGGGLLFGIARIERNRPLPGWEWLRLPDPRLRERCTSPSTLWRVLD